MTTRPAVRPLTDARSLLETRLSDLLGRDERLAARLRHDGGVPDDWPDRASALASEDVVSRLDVEARAEVVAIRGALARIDAGTYGACSRCGEEIGAARLGVLPSAELCVNCAS